MHIRRSYYQCRMWRGASNNKQCEIDPTGYGYTVNNDSMLVPVVMEH